MSKVFDVSHNKPQETFIFSDARIVGYIGGVGSGKTAAGAVKAAKKINAGLPGIIVGPDFPQFSRSTFPEFMKWAPLSRCVNAHLDHPYNVKKTLEFNINGKIVPVYYGGIDDPKSWAGPNVNWVWFDEAGRKRNIDAFNVLMGRIRIGDSPQMFITTSPSGKGHWLYDVFVKGVFDKQVMQQLRDDGFTGNLVEYVHASTRDNKMNLDPLYYSMLIGMYSAELAEQEVEGKFISLQGAVWPNFNENSVVSWADYVPGVPVEWWVDDGFTKGHPRVILFAQVIPPNIHVFDCYFALYELAEKSIEYCLNEKPYPKPKVAYVDSAAAELRARIWEYDIDTVKASHEVEEGIKRTSSWILDGDGVRHLFFHPRCEEAILEIQNYVRDEEDARPIKMSDNASDALRYGLWFKDRDSIIKEGVDRTPDNILESRKNDDDQNKIIVPQAGNMDLLAAYLKQWQQRLRI